MVGEPLMYVVFPGGLGSGLLTAKVPQPQARLEGRVLPGWALTQLK